MTKPAASVFACVAFLSNVALAEQPDAVATLTTELRARVPANWDVRVRWRDGQLLASVTPWPYQKAFELWYDIPKLLDILKGLCPGPHEEIWRQIEAKQDVILEPTVGGKSGLEARISCRKVLGT